MFKKYNKKNLKHLINFQTGLKIFRQKFRIKLQTYIKRYKIILNKY